MQWEDNTTAFIRPTTRDLLSPVFGEPVCGLTGWQKQSMFHTNCDRVLDTPRRPLCEIASKSETTVSRQRPSIIIQQPSEWQHSVATVTCLNGDMVHTFLACDAFSDCLITRRPDSRYSCDMDPPPPSFTCQNELQLVPYMLVCDHRQDCADGSDEDFCVFPSCQPHTTFDCGDGQVSICLCSDALLTGPGYLQRQQELLECGYKITHGHFVKKLLVTNRTLKTILV